jgi:hypothetical protein
MLPLIYEHYFIFSKVWHIGEYVQSGTYRGLYVLVREKSHSRLLG